MVAYDRPDRSLDLYRPYTASGGEADVNGDRQTVAIDEYAP
jgi:hypothetical protein